MIELLTDMSLTSTEAVTEFVNNSTLCVKLLY